jgi:hypothetical protein
MQKNHSIAYTTFILLILLSGCSTHRQSYKANPALIRPYRHSDQANEPYEAPFLAKYSKDSRSLWFLAADHTNDVESSTFKTIRTAFHDFRPQAVIVEGFEDTGVFSPKEYAEYARKVAKENFRTSTEPSYVVWLALENNVPFVPGEPQNKTIALELQKLGYEAIEYYYFDYARSVPGLREIKRANSLQQFKEYATKFFVGYFRDFDPAGHFKFEEFASWYKKKTGKKFNFDTINGKEFEPQVDRNPGTLNKLSHQVGMIREQHLLVTLERLLNQFDRVLVVYGSGHLVKQRDVLKDSLGEPENVKPY